MICCLHARQGARRAEQRAEKMDALRAPPVGNIDMTDRTDWTLHAGIVYKDADGAELLFCARKGRIHAGAIGHVAGDGHGAAAARAQISRDFGDLPFRPCGDRHGRASISQRLGNGLSEAPPSAGDEGDFALQPSGGHGRWPVMPSHGEGI